MNSRNWTCGNMGPVFLPPCMRRKGPMDRFKYCACAKSGQMASGTWKIVPLYTEHTF